MATWQQGINSGGFLAGIGAQNENAPKASDINATLGLIRENNDLARSGANNVALTGLRGLAGVADIYKQEQQQKALNAFNQVHANAWATGDPSGLFKFAQENPAFVAQAQQAFSGLNEQQRNDMGDLAMKANVALSQGPESYSKFITDNKDRLNRVGANPDWMIQTGVQNPEQLSHMLTTMSLGALGPEKAFAVQDKMVGREIDRGRLAETIRSNQAGEALQQRGQDITVRGQNISAKNAELSREIQRAELQDKVLDRQIARETNQIKLDELKQKQADVRQKAEIARADRQAAAQGAVDTFSTALDSLNEIEQSPGLSKAVGIRSAFPTVPGSDAANFEARLDTFKAQTFLPMVQSLKGMGALSDAEGKKLSDAVGALSPKMSEKAFRDSIGKIRNQLESKLSTVKKQFDYQEPVQNMPGKQSPAGSNFSSLWGD
ncbi:DNA transfer protein [Salmonella enterica subsp. enterica serovar Newport]|uniref:Acyltransferase n=2 Tax=Salmonella enterica TaxID=28901 RepID=A0A5U5GKK3_SALER|nr:MULTISPECIES: DNA transfer protein [Salmonella]EAA0897359.1 acyltransferase [Salmonella enterica subsp. enterica serovar Newport]EAO5496370.1 acyltransferase [Salmonella enterica]EBS1484269.1 acyltransferase [Salmonella enterica subsp. enterica serovar Manhattan]EBW6338216.1 acyltransferase [Salmonella enterica subsp. enterica serovar Oslo]ECI7966752.1 acyltransferase [Salmonella enterica subsp. enterica]EDB3011831.1 acyltransferase [Salmonella enterica subsp. enterica serovar Typhimurium]